MTDDLNDLLARRADRAHIPHDADATVALVEVRAAERNRRRRNRLTIVSGTAVVVAAATVGLVIADSGNAPHRAAPNNAGQQPSPVVVSSGNLATILPDVTPLHGSATGHGTRTRNLKQELERLSRRQLALQRKQRQQRLAAKARQARAHHAGGRGTTLVPVDPAPPQAEISLGLVPQGFQYLSLDQADTYYGPPGTPPADYFSDGIVVDVHAYIGEDKDYTLTVGGKPASYHTSGGFTIVRVRYSKKVDVGFQAPPAAKLTEAQALKMATTLDVRSTRHKTHG